MKAVIFDVQRFCIHDGPGIRTTVFFKGCPLKCVWCHNPESHAKVKELAFYNEKCKNCGACSSACKNHLFKDGKHILTKANCALCGECVSTCDYGALEILGKEESIENIMAEVIKDKTFYSTSGGGITLSGGEPLFQAEASIQLLKRAKEEGIHTCVETCGYLLQNTLEKIAEYVDLFLYDFKECSKEKHKEFTGVDNDLILSNLRFLNALGKKIVLRCPLIPTFNDREEHFEQIANLAIELNNVLKVEIMAYHNLGKSKYSSLNKTNHLKDLPNMQKSYKEQIAKKILSKIQQKTNRKIIVE